MTHSDTNRPSALLTAARAGAVVLAISVVAWLIWRAQRDAVPVVDPATPSAAQPATQPHTQEPSQSSTRPAAVLPSSKSLVIEPESPLKLRQPMMFSSKSGRPFVNPDATERTGGDGGEGGEGDGN